MSWGGLRANEIIEESLGKNLGRLSGNFPELRAFTGSLDSFLCSAIKCISRIAIFYAGQHISMHMRATWIVKVYVVTV